MLRVIEQACKPISFLINCILNSVVNLYLFFSFKYGDADDGRLVHNNFRQNQQTKPSEPPPTNQLNTKTN